MSSNIKQSEFPAPRNFNYWWNFGAILTFMLVLMIFTGVFLAMQYTPHVDMAFDSVERIMRDVNYGWLLRYLHSNGGTFFFIAVYIHIFRGLYYGSYKNTRELLWMFGVTILLSLLSNFFVGTFSTSCSLKATPIVCTELNFSKCEQATALKLGHLMDSGQLQLGCRI